MGIDDLLEMILLVAEMQGAQGQPEPPGAGAPSSRRELDKGRGPVATILVQNGTLHDRRQHRRGHGRMAACAR